MAKNLLFILLFVIINFNAFAVDNKSDSPLKSYDRSGLIKFGAAIGGSLLLTPEDLVNNPTIALSKVEPNLLNGLNGLGYGSSVNLGLRGKLFITDDIAIGLNIDYTGWESINTCNCLETTYISYNFLNLYHLGALSDIYIWKGLYATTELGLNFFRVEVNENSDRGNIYFAPRHFRLGFSLGLGYEFELPKNFDFSITAKSHFLNLLNPLGSEDFINSVQAKEELMLMTSINLSLLYTL